MGELPHFNPDDDRDPLDPPVATLRAQIGSADALLICTPEYAGALPGSFKNLLDWTVGGGETYGKPVAWINASGPAAPTGGSGAHDSLRSVLRYTGADIAEPACRRVPLTRQDIGPDGFVADTGAREAIAEVLAALASHVAQARAGAAR
jgi:NAD(P)H-dependent FMN reductase